MSAAHFSPVRTLNGQASDRLAFLLATAVVFLSPYNILRYPGIYITAADLLAILSFLVLLVSGRLPLSPLGRLTPVWYAGFLAIVGGMLIGSLANHRLIASLDVNAQYAFAMIVLPWVLCGRSSAQIRCLLLVWAASIVIVMLHGIYLMQFTNDPPVNMVSPSGRLRGVLERETELAALGAIAIVVMMYLSADRIFSLITSLLLALILLYGIALTASNTGVLALAGGIAAFTILQGSMRHYGVLVLLSIVGLAFVLFGGRELIPEAFMGRVAGALSSGDLGQAGTFDDRWELTQEGWQVSADHILIGLGTEGFRLISAYGQPVHNTYVLLLVEGGLLSLVGLCAIIGAAALRGATLLFHADTRNLGALVVAIAVIFALVLNTFAHIYARFWIVPLILVMSLAAGCEMPRQKSRFVHRSR